MFGALKCAATTEQTFVKIRGAAVRPNHVRVWNIVYGLEIISYDLVYGFQIL
jgi:hypothetical protein